MATKTIPQLNELTAADGEALIPIDTGTETFKIKSKNLIGGRHKYKAILGSAAQVTANLATHSTWASMIAAVSAGDCVRVLPGTWVENVVIDKQLQVEGSGYGSYIDGSLTLSSAADRCTVEGLRTNDDITLDSGADGNVMKNLFLPVTNTVVDNGSGNLVEWMRG